MNLKVEAESMPIILAQEVNCVSPQPRNFSLDIHYSNPNSQQCDDVDIMNSSRPVLILGSDYSSMCKNLETGHGELLDCRVHNKESAKLSDCSSEKVKTINTRVNRFIAPKTLLSSLLVSKSFSKVEQESYFFNQRLTNQIELLKNSDGPNQVKKRTRKKQVLECFKCHFCPFMTLKEETILIHANKKGTCKNDNNTIHCPGCTNVFYSNISLRVHLAHDHNMLPKNVKKILQHINIIKIVYVAGEEPKSSCVYSRFNGGDEFETIRESENLERSSCAVEEQASANQQRPSCANNKPLSLLESYLDDISNKNDCSLPPRLSSGGDDILENTFNFTAPVSEQLPSIQPENPAAASGLDQEQFIEESTHLHESDLMDETSDIDEQTHLDLNNEQFIEAVSSRSIKLITNENDQKNISNVKKSGDESLDGKLLSESQVLKDQQHFSISTSSNHFLNISDTFPHQDSYNNDRLEDFAYSDPDLPVASLDVKNHEAFEYSPIKRKTELISDKKLNKMDCGYRCDISGCKLRMQNEGNIEYHRRCHEGQLYNCPECCKDYSNWLSLSGHLWQIHKIDMELFKCDLCSYRTPSYSRLTSIHRGIHGTARPFLCDSCGKGFKTIKQMRNHKITHKDKLGDNSYSLNCEVCGRPFSNRRSLEQHVKNLHEKQKPFLCSMCGYSTSLKHSLAVHIRKHTGEKPHKCDKCNYQSADHNSLRRHKMIHNRNMKYKCVHCSYSCIQSSSYKMHIKHKHPGLEEEMIFKCEHCSFETLQHAKFLAHSVLHEGSHSDPDPLAYYPDIVQGGTIVDLSNAQTLLEDEYYEVNDDSLQPV